MPDPASPVADTTPSGHRPSAGRRAIDWLLAAGWVAITVTLLAALAGELRFLADSPGWVSMWESGPLQVAMDAARGGRIYGDFENGPVHLAIYGPLYHQMLAWLAEAVHADVSRLIATARWLGIGSIAIGLVGVAWLVRRAGAGSLAIIVSLACAMLFTRTAIRFIAGARPDATAAALSVLALIAALGRRRASAVLAAALFTAALQTKMTAVAAPIAAAILLWQAGQRRRLALIAGLCIAANAIVLIALYVATDGWAWRHLTVASAAPMRFAHLRYLVARAADAPQAQCLMVFPLLALLTARWWPGLPTPRADRRPYVDAAGPYYLASILVAAITGLHQGSDLNYLIEPTLAAGAVLGTWTTRAAAAADLRAWRITRGIATLVLACSVVLFLPDRFARFGEEARALRDLDSPYSPQAIGWARTLPQPLLSLDPWLTLRADVYNDLNDPIAYVCQLRSADGIDPIAERVVTGRYQAVVVFGGIEDTGFVYDDIPRIWPALQEAVNARYRFAGTKGPWALYGLKPQPRADGAPAATMPAP